MAVIHALQQLGSLVAGIMMAAVLLYCALWIASIPYQAAQAGIRNWRRATPPAEPQATPGG
jgi:hypothetical protein